MQHSIAGMKRLPPISPSSQMPLPGGASPSSAMFATMLASDAVDRENPYEQTWSILRALKAEVRELQAAVQEEQQLRHDEVTQLQKELHDCRDEMSRERDERKAEHGRHTTDHHGESLRLQEDMRKGRQTREQQVRELQEQLANEHKQRTEDIRQLSERLKAEEAARAKESKGLADALAHARSLLDATWTTASMQITSLTQDVKVISDQLIRTSSTWAGFRGESLVSTRPTRPPPSMVSSSTLDRMERTQSAAAATSEHVTLAP